MKASISGFIKTFSGQTILKDFPIWNGYEGSAGNRVISSDIEFYKSCIFLYRK